MRLPSGAAARSATPVEQIPDAPPRRSVPAAQNPVPEPCRFVLAADDIATATLEAERAASRQDWTRAAAVWRHCIDLFPAHASIAWWSGLGTALRRIGREGEADDAFHSLCRHWPHDPAGWRGLAENAVARRDWAAAADAWRACIERFGEKAHPSWWAGLGGALRWLKKLDEADRVFADARARWPANPTGCRGQAEIASERGDWTVAANAWAECLERFPDRATASWTAALGTALWHLGRRDDARATWVAARTRWPADPAGWVAPARALAMAGRPRLAARAWAEALRQPAVTREPGLLAHAAQALARAGRHDEAMAQCEALRQLSPNDPRWMSEHINVLLALGDAPGAVEALKRFAALPRFRDAFSPARSASILAEAAVAPAQALALADTWYGTQAARDAVDQAHSLPTVAPEESIRQAADVPTQNQYLRPDWLRQCRVQLRSFLLDRRFVPFDRFARVAVRHASRDQLERLRALAVARFPRSRVRIQLDAMLQPATRPASDPDVAFAFRWQPVMPAPEASIAGQLRGRGRRRLVCAVVVRDEEEMLRRFVQHHHALGVDSFIVVDNGSARSPRDTLPELPGVEITVVNAPHSFVRNRHGMAWINEILELDLCEWLLFADADEQLAYPGCDDLPIGALLDHLDRRGETVMTATMIDVFDRGFLAGGPVSADPADHTLFVANLASVQELRPPWRLGFGGIRAGHFAGAYMHKTPLVKASAGIRYSCNHHVTPCVPAATTGSLVHLKVLRDRDMLVMGDEDVVSHSRVRDRGVSCVTRHIAFARAYRDTAREAPFHLTLSEERLLRLGVTSADPDWRVRLPHRLAPDLASASAPLRRELAACREPDLRGFLGNPSLRTLLDAIRHLGGQGRRQDLRVLLRAELPRIGAGEIGAGLLLASACALGRQSLAQRLLGRATRAIRQGGAAVAVGGVVDIADRLADAPAVAMALIDSLPPVHATDPRVMAWRANVTSQSGDFAGTIAALGGSAPSHRDGTLRPYLTALSAMGAWDDYAAAMDRALRIGDMLPDPSFLMRVNVVPEEALRRSFLARMAELMGHEAARYHGSAASTWLAVLHLLDRRDAFDAAYRDLAPRLPRIAARYYQRLLAARSGAAPVNRAWALGLSKTGTTSLHEYCERLGLLSAHYINPVLQTLLTPQDCDLFDVVSDTPVIYLARRDGVPAGRATIVTTRDFGPWSKSFLSHFGRLFDQRRPSFGSLRDAFAGARRFRFGPLWHDIHAQLYFSAASLQDAYDAHRDWIATLSPAPLEIALEAEGKGPAVSAFLGLGGRTASYPHANKARTGLTIHAAALPDERPVAQAVVPAPQDQTTDMTTTTEPLQDLAAAGRDAAAARDWNEAARLFEAAVRQQGDRPTQSLMAQWARALRQAQRWTEADPVHAILRERWPNHAAGWAGAAESASARQAWTQAADFWQECCTRLDNEARPHWYAKLSQALLKLQRLDEAAAAARVARDRWPESHLGWLRGAEAARAKADWPETVALLEETRSRFPDKINAAWENELARARKYVAPARPVADACETLLAQAMSASRGHRNAEALPLWRECMEKWPDRATLDWYKAYGQSLLEINRPRPNPTLRKQLIEEATTLFATMRERWPEEPLGWVGEAEIAGWRWKRLEARPLWEALFERFDGFAEPSWYEGYEGCLWFANDRDELERVRSARRARWPAYNSHWDRGDAEFQRKRAEEGKAPSLRDVEFQLTFGTPADAKAVLEKVSQADRDSRAGKEFAQILRTIERSSLNKDIADSSIDFSARTSTVVWRNPAGSDRVIVAFSGGGQRFWLSLDGLHKVLRGCGAHVIYMRDFSQSLYLAGDPEAGLDYRGMLALIRRQVNGLGASRLVCLGNSAGGYAALRYGLDLDAESVISFSGITDLEKWRNPMVESEFKDVVRHNPGMKFDIRAAYLEASRTPRTIMCFGRDHDRDRMEAERMGDLPGVRLMPVEGFSTHNVFRWFLANDKFDDLVAELFGDRGK